ncbi:hypothetical protein BDN67DRAFT_984806 [Paxillus ammoniavirescens]|nr:hypothetical protein BDN67DRAFT_984806 [Paxillus ammoniavirescens]
MSVPSEETPSTPTSSRCLAQVNRVLSTGYEKLEVIVTDLAAQTLLSTSQIIEGWHKSHGRIIDGMNHWNLYAKYFAKHEAQEHRRLGLPLDVSITPTVRGQLYMKFKEENTEMWQEILEIHEMIEMSDSPLQAVTQRAQMFNKIRKKLTSLLEGAVAQHGFEAALVMCGNIVNEDASLGFVHETAGALKFYETRSRADGNTMIRHLKSHIYNNVSLNAVSEAFNSDGDHVKENQQPPPPMNAPPARAAVHFIKEAIVILMKDCGGDVSKFRQGSFPWGTLLGILANQGLVFMDWPHGVLMPSQLWNENTLLYSTFINKDISIMKLQTTEERNNLINSKTPVIVSSAPPADSLYPNGQQMYADGTISHNSLPHLSRSSMATHIKRKPTMHPATEEPIVISSSDSLPHAPPLKKTKVKVVIPKASVQKKSEVIVLDHSSESEVSSSLKAGSQSEDTSSSNNNQARDTTIPSRKRKANNNLPIRRAVKKHAPSEMVPTRAGSRKGKERAVDRSESDEETIPTKKQCSRMTAARVRKNAIPIVPSDSEEEIQHLEPNTVTESGTFGSSRYTAHQAGSKAPMEAEYETPSSFKLSSPPHRLCLKSIALSDSDLDDPALEPPSPSPKRRRLAPLTELQPEPEESLEARPDEGMVTTSWSKYMIVTK